MNELLSSTQLSGDRGFSSGGASAASCAELCMLNSNLDSLAAMLHRQASAAAFLLRHSLHVQLTCTTINLTQFPKMQMQLDCQLCHSDQIIRSLNCQLLRLSHSQAWCNYYLCRRSISRRQ